MSNLWKEGFRGTLFLLDDKVQVPIDSLQIDDAPAEALQYLANVRRVANRPKPFRTAIPPDKVDPLTFTLKIDSGLDEVAHRQIARLKGYPQPIAFCPWIRIVEWFTWPVTVGGRKLKTWRQSALEGVPEAFWPAGAAADHAAVEVVDGVTGTPTVSGSPDAYGQQQWDTEATPATDDIIEIQYTPMFLCWRLASSERMPGRFQHERSITLVEI